jgi:hypothetical protein
MLFCFFSVALILLISFFFLLLKFFSFKFNPPILFFMPSSFFFFHFNPHSFNDIFLDGRFPPSFIIQSKFRGDIVFSHRFFFFC